MDADGFDALTRALSGAGSSRRRVLTGLAGSSLAALAAGLGLADTSAMRCRGRQSACTSAGQCCGHNKGSIDCAAVHFCSLPGRRCCGKKGATCSHECGCCGEMSCLGGKCRP